MVYNFVIMIILSGPSASGKTEVAKLLGIKYGLKKVITHTTRPKRFSEVNGVDYHFVTRDEFLELMKEDYFVETTLYNGNYYGTSKNEVGSEKVLIVDPNGLKIFTALNNRHIVSFYMLAKDDTRFNRMIMRGDSLDLAKKRIANDLIEFQTEKISGVDYYINTETNNIEQVTDLVYSLYQKKLKD